MSSEKRSMRLNTLDKDVPPLKRGSGTCFSAKRCLSVQQTQKSFSTAVVVELQRLVVSSKKECPLRRIEFCKVVHRRDYAVICWSTGCIQAGAAAASRFKSDSLSFT
jgi:hypothetical protein